MTHPLKQHICNKPVTLALRSKAFKACPISIGRRRRYATRPITQNERPFRMAVIGSGPAGFYTAYKVMSMVEHAIVDMYEHLPVPFGLVRFGVAPDHPEVKNCQDKFAEVAESPNFNFIGNIAIGAGSGSIPLSALALHYDAILFAYGAAKDKALGIPGEHSLKGVYSARAFVGWYNGLPQYAELVPDLDRGSEAIVIGQGNVALDVARILLSDVDQLRHTDITESSLEVLSKNRVKSVRVIGRRGPMQAAFTIREARELMKLPSVFFHPIDPSLFPSDLSSLPRTSKRIIQLLMKGSVDTSSSIPKSWSLDFLLSPTSFNASAYSSDHLSSISFQKNTLHPNQFHPEANARASNSITEIAADIAFISIGYKSEKLSGLADLGIPFDERQGIIPSDQFGRVIDPSRSPGSSHVPRMYCAGWVKRGPTGVIASTMNDAFLTAEAIAYDWKTNNAFYRTGNIGGSVRRGWEGLKDEAEQRGCRRVNWEDWKRIDSAERDRGRKLGKVREKFTSVTDMLAVL